MAFTYDELIADARTDLKDENGVTYKAPLMTKLVNDAVQIARKLLAAQNPEMIWTTKAINLAAANAGPYAISTDFESPVKLLDEYEKEIGDSYRGEYNVSSRSGKPDGVWIEGHAPANLYVNSTPEKAYAWTLYYIATAARVASAGTSAACPLPAFLREKLVAWIVKFAADSKEFITTTEDQKIKLMEELVGDILLSRRSKIVLNVTGVGF